MQSVPAGKVAAEGIAQPPTELNPTKPNPLNRNVTEEIGYNSHV